MTLLHIIKVRDNRGSEGLTLVMGLNVITLKVMGPCRWDQHAVSKRRSYPRKAEISSAEPPKPKARIMTHTASRNTQFTVLFSGPSVAVTASYIICRYTAA